MDKNKDFDGGKRLRKKIHIAKKKQDEESIIDVVNELRNAYVILPCNLKVVDVPLAKDGKDVVLAPDILETDGKKFLPVFSNIEQMGKDYASQMSKLEKTMAEAVKFAMARDDITGIVVDPYTDTFVVLKQLFELIVDE